MFFSHWALLQTWLQTNVLYPQLPVKVSHLNAICSRSVLSAGAPMYTVWYMDIGMCSVQSCLNAQCVPDIKVTTSI